MATTTVSAETGASKVKISIPKNVACQIKVDSGLSSNDFDGFTKRDENTYQTDNFDDARNKLVINLEGGLSKFEVKRY